MKKLRGKRGDWFANIFVADRDPNVFTAGLFLNFNECAQVNATGTTDKNTSALLRLALDHSFYRAAPFQR
jgi:hypothetical protein